LAWSLRGVEAQGSGYSGSQQQADDFHGNNFDNRYRQFSPIMLLFYFGAPALCFTIFCERFRLRLIGLLQKRISNQLFDIVTKWACSAGLDIKIKYRELRDESHCCLRCLDKDQMSLPVAGCPNPANIDWRRPHPCNVLSNRGRWK
jgi:hypothetical protein